MSVVGIVTIHHPVAVAVRKHEVALLQLATDQNRDQSEDHIRQVGCLHLKPNWDSSFELQMSQVHLLL